jgi:subfamily B ATP-binding cassette protein MsbA
MMAEACAALAVPWFGGRLAADMMAAGGDGAAAALSALLALFAAQAVLKYANGVLLGEVAATLAADLKVRLYDHLQALPVGFFQQRRLGESLALLTHDASVVAGFASGTAIAIVPLALTAAGSAWFMIRLQPALAAWALVLVPLFYLVLKLTGRRLRPLARQVHEGHAAAIAIAEENIGLLPAIKVFAREAEESARHAEQVGRVRDLTVRQARIAAALGPAMQFLAVAAVMLILWLASGPAGAAMSRAELVTFLLYAYLLARPVAGFANLYGQWKAVQAARARLDSAFGETPEPPPHAGLELPRLAGAIAFEGVRFSYPGRAPALDRFDLAIAAGETVAITGPNGAGKSTMAHLLLRLHPLAAGRITLDGIDIAQASLASLRRQVGIVPQHVLLFHASVGANIAYGRQDATQAEIEAAARAARAHDFIAALPDGYDTVIGDHGVQLSGGQQQRLALARALLRDPPILILDEATAMLDPEGEREFLEGMRETFRRRTVILITHRPASLALADRVIPLA